MRRAVSASARASPRASPLRPSPPAPPRAAPRCRRRWKRRRRESRPTASASESCSFPCRRRRHVQPLRAATATPRSAPPPARLLASSPPSRISLRAQRRQRRSSRLHRPWRCLPPRWARMRPQAQGWWCMRGGEFAHRLLRARPRHLGTAVPPRRRPHPKRARTPDFLIDFLRCSGNGAILPYQVVETGSLGRFESFEALPNGTRPRVAKELVERRRLGTQ